ncbi:ADP-ribosylglycohydrolase family protein [Luoshenia tenuis]|jgi:ADP-ribosylglycohydrolase|uniref:ADP-ribosylglycohydrolase family protein n=1 Tax=Luoshenia tenuis TaxID=2763654 RepID=UPI003D8DBDD0
MRIPQDYFSRVYAGWLGKVIGIRLGAPVEGWTYEKIARVYGELTDYPMAFRNFAADDDSNGPIFFARALEDCRDLTAFSAQDVGEALLNYAPYEHGFFWWGGYGVSTEHTAYLNLRAGIPAPRSGSSAQNGKTVAEQIGGQIFIDPWGLVAPGNPKLAAELARKAASVTHDGEGVYGGIFVACCISLAFTLKDIKDVMAQALTFIPAQSEYARVVEAVSAFYRAHPEDWRACFGFVKANFGYDKYPGNCHIIPNAGVMALAMLYGGGDFSRTITICNMCGWDTDCNAGNVGCIMGVLCGLEGIEEKWIKPIGDFLACSSVLGALNAQDIPYGAGFFARMAYRLAGEEMPKPWREVLSAPQQRCHFEFPGSTHALRVQTGGLYHLANTEEQAHTGNRSLRWVIGNAASGELHYLYKQTYYRPEDFDDSRYDPAFSPLVYPGQRLHLSIRPGLEPGEMAAWAQPYVRDGRTGEVVTGQWVVLDQPRWYELSLQIPAGSGLIGQAGVILCGRGKGFESSSLTVYVDDLYFDGTPAYTVDFAQENIEVWNGALHQEISQFTRLKGVAYLEGDCLGVSCNDFGAVYTGGDFEDYSCSATLEPVIGQWHLLNFRVQGAIRSYAAGFAPDGRLVLMKNQNGYRILCSCPFPWEHAKRYRLSVSARGAALSLAVDGEVLLAYEDEDAPYLRGAVGLCVLEGSHCRYRDLEVASPV